MNSMINKATFVRRRIMAILELAGKRAAKDFRRFGVNRLSSSLIFLSLIGSLNLLPAAAIAETTALVGATLVDGRGGEPVPNSTVIVEDGQIVAVGSTDSIEIPAGATTVDLSGQWLMPGMIDTHVHFMESGKMAMDAVMRSLDENLSEADDIAWLKQRTPYTLERYLCSGVTTVVSLGGPEHIEFGARRQAEQMDRAPRVLIAGGPIGNSGFEWIFDGADAVFAADTEAEMQTRIREFASLGADAIKLGYIGAAMGSDTSSTPQQYRPVIEAAVQEAHRQGLPVLVHIMTKEEAEAFVDTGLDAFAHLPFDEPVSDEFISQVIERDIFIAPTIAVFPRIIDVMDERLVLNDIERRCADPEVVQDYADYADGFMSSMMMNVADWGMTIALGNPGRDVADSAIRLHEAGARFIIGSDASHIGTMHGVAMHVEMQMLEDAGLPAATLIQAATINAAELMGVDTILGSVESGKLADLVVLDADPTLSIRNAQRISMIIKDGHVIDHASLTTDVDDSQLVAIQFRHQFLETLILVELICLLAVWLGWRFGPGIPWTRKMAVQMHQRKMEAMEKSPPLILYKRSVDEGRHGLGLMILSTLISLKSLGAAVMGIIMVYWLPLATMLLMPGIIETHRPEQSAFARRVFARVTIAQVTSHAIAAALGFVLTRTWWVSETGFWTLISQNMPTITAALAGSFLVAILAAWLELRAHAVHKLL
jgi:imidazolonepropionase-like amidohydrolase